jgi:hypothetical protein
MCSKEEAIENVILYTKVEEEYSFATGIESVDE